MRIISGTAKGCKLSEFSVSAIRPTSDRVREAIFSILTSRLGNMKNLSVLDLFAGSGAMGLEALSRGAGSATFIDQDKEAVGLIRKNMTSTKLTEHVEVIQSGVLNGIKRQTGPFDLIFVDPPYSEQNIKDILLLLAEKAILKPGGVICVETAQATLLPETVPPLMQIDRRKYGSTSITLYEHGEFSQ